MAEIVLDGVRKRFGQTTVVSNLSLAVSSGEFVTLLGPSGCGKTTTLNMIAGLEEVNDGSIAIGGRRVDELPPDRRDLAFVFQDYALYPHMTVAENMAFGLKMRKTSKAEIATRLREAAERLEIGHLLDRKPRELSGGQRQRVALGRAIVRRPAVFLFDEPLSNLDALLRDQTRSEIKRLHQELGTTSVYVTHDQEEALSLSDRIAVLRDGLLEQYGTPADIYERPATEFVAGFVGKPRMNLFDAHRGPDGRLQVAGTQLAVEVAGDVPERVRIGLRPDELVVEPNQGDGAAGQVKLVEPLGNATDLSVDLGGETVTVRVRGISELSLGDTVTISNAQARPHLFDARTGERIEHEAPAAA